MRSFKNGATADSQHTVVFAQGCFDGRLFELAELILALLEKDVGDPLAGSLLDIEIGVAEGGAEPAREHAADRALACSGRTDQHDQRRHRTTSVSR